MGCAISTTNMVSNAIRDKKLKKKDSNLHKSSKYIDENNSSIKNGYNFEPTGSIHFKLRNKTQEEFKSFNNFTFKNGDYNDKDDNKKKSNFFSFDQKESLYDSYYSSPTFNIPSISLKSLNKKSSSIELDHKDDLDNICDKKFNFLNLPTKKYYKRNKSYTGEHDLLSIAKKISSSENKD